MEEKYLEIYNYLTSIEKLDSGIYSDLLSRYNEDLVNKVIDQMIDDDPNNIKKFDYYLSNIIVYDKMVSKSLFEYYGDDISLIPMLTADENINLSKYLYEIIDKIRVIVGDELNLDSDKIEKIWICDLVDRFMAMCNDEDKLRYVKSLYNEFLDKRNKLVQGNMRLVILVAKEFNINESIFMDCIQYGNMGLMRAVDKFNPSFNTIFTTYAYMWIKQFIMRYVYNLIYPYYIPEYQVGIYQRYKKVQKKLFDKLGRSATDGEIAKEMDINISNVESLKCIFNDTISLYAIINGGNAGGSMLIDFIEDRDFSVSKEIDYKDLCNVVNNSIDSSLNERERMVIRRRFGFDRDECETLESIGRDFGITRERIRQIENKAIRKLSKCKNLYDYR